MILWRALARYRHARRRKVEAERRIGARLATWATPRPRPAPDDLRRAWQRASPAERVRFLEDVEQLPY